MHLCRSPATESTVYDNLLPEWLCMTQQFAQMKVIPRFSVFSLKLTTLIHWIDTETSEVKQGKREMTTNKGLLPKIAKYK
jgi:hypothetical protein